MDDRTTLGLIQRARPIGPSDRILDLACGTGGIARLLRDRLGGAASIAGLDSRSELVAEARAAAPSVEWADGAPSALPFADGSFELVLCQHLGQLARELGPSLGEVRRVLTPGGRFIGTSHEAETVRAALLETGFTDVSIERSGTADVLSARRP
jgi:ubiquinone/menaquinone biosynthesis C-methylase UbiE